MRIDADKSRFDDIIRGKVRRDIKRFATSEEMIGQQGKKMVKIPLASINIPRFTYGGQGGGASMGDGEIGDGIGDGQGNGKPGKGDKAGEGEGDHLEMEFSIDDLVDMLKEELELPDLEPKGKGEVSTEKAKYNEISDIGVVKNFKATYKQALKRSVSSGIYSPDQPIVVPIRKDYRYKTSSDIPKPETNCVIYFTLDASGSMTDEARSRAQRLCFWVDAILARTYKNIQSEFIIHDTVAKQISREKFFKVSSGGGTQISSAYKLIAKLMETKYPFSDWNEYIISMGDGDNISSNDNELCGQILKEQILPNCNAFNFGETKTQGGSGDFARYLEGAFANEEKVNIATIDSDDDILKCIKRFFEKGQ